MHVLILNAHGDDVVRNHIGSLSPRRPGARSRGPERRSSTGCRSHHNPSQPIVNGGMVTEANLEAIAEWASPHHRAEGGQVKRLLRYLDLAGHADRPVGKPAQDASDTGTTASDTDQERGIAGGNSWKGRRAHAQGGDLDQRGQHEQALRRTAPRRRADAYAGRRSG